MLTSTSNSGKITSFTYMWNDKTGKAGILLESVCVCVCACTLSHFSHVQLFATLWTVAHQAPLSMGFSRQRILEWVAMPSSRGSSRPRDRTHIPYISCIGERVLYHLCHLEVVKQNSKLRMYVKLCTSKQFLAFQL